MSKNNNINNILKQPRQPLKQPRQTRYGHVLRRLIDGKTSNINYRIAEQLQSDGLVVIKTQAMSSTVPVELTERGKVVAELAKKGAAVYVGHKLSIKI